MRQAAGNSLTGGSPAHRSQPIKHTIALIIILCLGLGQAGAATLVMPLEQVKPGMKGKGKSVFLGGRVEEFNVEILGILENVQPKKSIILARLSGMGLENTGIIQGMSGSPVYIDGKIIGAVAFSFAFAKEPIAGITPIGQMLSIPGQPAQPPSPPGESLPFRISLSADDILSFHKGLFSSRESYVSQGQTLLPIGVPLQFGGFSPATVERARSIFGRLGFLPIASGASGETQAPLPATAAALQEGDPVAVELVRGDLSVAAVGTVTYVDGNKILAFGHPLYNLGAVDYGMSRASVLAVVPSLESSFKVAAIGAKIGRFYQDRTSGALGEVGAEPRLIPVTVRLIDALSKAREFKLGVTNDRILSPLLLNLAVASLLSAEERSFGNLSVALDGNVYLDSGTGVHLEDLFSGNLDTAVSSLSGLLMAVVYYLANNEFEDVGFHRIDLNIRAVEEAKFAALERVWLDKYEASAGERIQVKVFYRTFGGQSFQETVDIDAPPLPAGSEFHLIIADAASMHQVEMVQYRNQDFIPRSLGQLVRILNNLRKNNRIYFKLLALKPGLFVKGEEMPNLPPSMKSMFGSPRAASSSPTELTRSTLREYQLPIPYVFRGMASIPVKIKR